MVISFVLEIWSARSLVEHQSVSLQTSSRPHPYRWLLKESLVCCQTRDLPFDDISNICELGSLVVSFLQLTGMAPPSVTESGRQLLEDPYKKK